MKKIRLLSIIPLLALAFASCDMSLEESPSASPAVAPETGSLSIDNSENVSTSGASARVLYVGELGYARATVTGDGITNAITSDFISLTNGAGSLSVSGIPVGNNRIVTVQAYDKDKQAIDGAVVSSIVNITTGANSCRVTQSTTALANVYTKLKALGKTLNSIDSKQFSSYIDANYSWALIDTDAIAADYVGGVLASKTSAAYIKTTGKVNSTSALSGYTLQITDPSSKTQSLSSENSFIDAAPGTWKILALKDGNVVASETIKVVSGKETTVKVYETSTANTNFNDKTIVFVKASSAPTIWAWEDGGVGLSEKCGEDWNTPSGSVMAAVTSDYMASYSGWYMKDFTSVATGKTIKFKLNRSDPEIPGKAGTFWYDSSDGSTVTENPSPVSSTSESKTVIAVVNPVDPNDITDKIKVHAKYKYIYIWETGTSIDETTSEMTAEGGDWFTYTINTTSANIIFKTASDWSGSQTVNLSRTEAGEYWFYNNKWYTANPEDSVAPVLTSFTSNKSGTVSGAVILTVSATDNMGLTKAVITSGTDTLGTIALSGTSATESFTWNTSYVQNDTYKLVATVYDSAGNTSETKLLSLTTSNTNLPPVAKITGTISAGVGKTIAYSAANSYDQNGGTIASYKWTVSGATADSTTAQKINVTMPSTEGTAVTISLIVTDNDGTSSESTSISVKTVKVDENWDFRDETIYFLMTTRFYDGDTSNNAYCWDDEECFHSITLGDPGWRGDFKGLIEKLDYIKALGFSAIWITPVVENSSGLDYHGYHASNFSKVDPRYAGLNEDPMQAYQKLIDACHEKGIKVIQDIVLNHTSNFGEDGFFRLFDTADKRPGSDGVTKTIDAFATDTTAGALSSGLYGLNCLKAALGGTDYWTLAGGRQYDMRIAAMKEDANDIERAYHHEKSIQWEGYTVQTGQMAGDCVDINTENHKVAEYIRNAYIQYINMGVDAFRIDTVKHISRLTFNKEFLPYFKEAGAANGKDFFMFGEGCVLRNEVWNDNKPPISVPFYTWKGNDDSYSWSETDPKANEETVYQHYNDNLNVGSQPTSTNAFLNGNAYHEPDRSKSSGLDMIDFYMHHCFGSAGSAFGVAKQEDQYFNDATYNVTYVDSHDYGPNEGGYLYMRYSGGTQAWASNFNFMFTFRGIPCVYYGSEIEFQKNKQIEPYTNGNKVAYAESGRAYYGEHLEGTVTASDYGVYTASGTVKETLDSTLSQHLIRLNKIRRAIPALRKGQYSTDGCNGSIAYKRRYTKNGIDSFVLVTIDGQATFSGIPSGTYVEVITGKTVTSSGSLTTDSIGGGNMRVYVLQTGDGVEPTSKIGTDGAYLK